MLVTSHVKGVTHTRTNMYNGIYGTKCFVSSPQNILISAACVSDARSWSFSCISWQRVGSSGRMSAALNFRLTRDNLAFGGKSLSTPVSLAALQMFFL